MDHLLEPLDTLRRKGVEFIRDPNVRLLCLGIDAPLRSAALLMLRGLEWHPDNQHAFFFLESAAIDGSSWGSWGRELTGGYGELLATGAHAGLPALVAVSGASELPDEGEKGFCRLAVRIQRAIVQSGIAGMTIVVAPIEEADVDLLANAFWHLVDDSDLAACRWIWLRHDHQVPPTNLTIKSKHAASAIAVDKERERVYLDSLLGDDERVFVEAWPDEPPPPVTCPNRPEAQPRP